MTGFPPTYAFSFASIGGVLVNNNNHLTVAIRWNYAIFLIRCHRIFDQRAIGMGNLSCWADRQDSNYSTFLSFRRSISSSFSLWQGRCFSLGRLVRRYETQSNAEIGIGVALVSTWESGSCGTSTPTGHGHGIWALWLYSLEYFVARWQLLLCTLQRAGTDKIGFEYRVVCSLEQLLATVQYRDWAGPISQSE